MWTSRATSPNPSPSNNPPTARHIRRAPKPKAAQVISSALAQLQALADPAKAAEALAYHKVDRPYLGLRVPQIEELTSAWRADLSLEDRIQLASDLWDSNIHDARIAAAKLLTQARIKPEQDKRKLAEIGRLPAPPKYTSADFLKTGYWRLRGGLDVPKERCFTVPDPQAPGDWLYGWAGWNPAQRVRALAGAWIDGEERSGADPAQLLPLLIALDEELPWVLQWHNAIDPDTDVRPGDYFRDWLAQQLNRHHWTRQTLAEWQPPAAPRRGRRAPSTS